MGPLAALTFDTGGWSGLLTAAAAAALLWEVIALVRRVASTAGGGRAAGVCILVLLTGPVMAAIVGLYRAAVPASQRHPFTPTLWRASLRATLLMAMAAGVVFAGGVGAVVALGGCAVLWVLRSYRRTTRPLPARWRTILLAARILVVLLIAAWALHPGIDRRRTERVDKLVLIGLDVSASMQREDMPADAAATQPSRDAPGISRIDAARRALTDAQGVLEELDADAEIIAFAFDAESGPVAPLETRAGWRILRDTSPTGQATAIGDSLATAYNYAVSQADEPARSVAAVVLISDGCNNTSDAIAPDKLARLMGARGAAVHTVGVGSEQITPATSMLNVKDLAAPQQVEAFGRLPIRADVEAVGLAGRDLRVTCRFDDEVVGEQTVAVGDDRQTHPVRFVHVPLASGFHRVTVAAEPLGESPSPPSGRPMASRLVQVVDRGVRVLYVEGGVRYESKYIARALTSGERFTLDRRIIPAGAPPGGGLSEELDDWLTYHAIILGDVPAWRFTLRQLAIMRQLVGDYGKGLCMIGGPGSFAPGEWAGTPVDAALPVDCAASTGQIDEPIRVVPSAEGLDSEIMQIVPAGEEAPEAWAKLPALSGASRLAGVKPGARVLATDGQDHPLVVAQRYGEGRTMAIAFDTTWRWVLTPEPTGEYQKRFWRQVALYLAAPRGNVWIATGQSSYDLRRLERGTEAIEVTAGVEDPQGRPMPDAPVTVRLIGPGDDARDVQLRTEGDVRRATLPPPRRPGVYTLQIEAEAGGRKMTARNRFEIVSRDMESLDALANLDLLRRMAQLGGGRYAPLREFEEVLGELRISAQPQTRELIDHQDFSRLLAWPVVVAAIVLLCAEWATRKRKGLV